MSNETTVKTVVLTRGDSLNMLASILVDTGEVPTMTQARRLILQGAVKIQIGKRDPIRVLCE